MIIDFHTHTFPDKIAAETIKYLASKGNTTPYREGTLSSLKASMKKAGIDYSVVLPVATSPKQVQSINRLSVQENGKDGVFFAGAIHPDCENIEEILDSIKSSGLFGVKIHPDYQGVYFDDARYIRILREAAKRDLVTVTHAGVDVGYPNDVHCTPQMVLNVLERLSGLIDGKLILAHMGGYQFPDEVEKRLVGKPVYFDTAYVLDRYPEKCKELIEKHGFDKILFATDSPWSDQKKFVDLLRSFGFGEEENNRIFYRNAEKLLKNRGHEYL